MDTTFHADRPKEFDPHHCLVKSGALLSAHELEAFKRGAEFLWYGHTSSDTLIGSGTTGGYLMSYVHERTGRTIHEWTYDH